MEAAGIDLHGRNKDEWMMEQGLLGAGVDGLG